MNIDLKELTQLAPIFRELFKGYHISRAAPELYTQLSNQQDAYRALFKSLGYELVCDSRGFYYFVPEQMGAQVNKTDVVLLEASLLGIEELDDAYMASVEFSGMIREEPSAGPSPFREVWNMTKPKTGNTGWLVAGVQALQ